MDVFGAHRQRSLTLAHGLAPPSGVRPALERYGTLAKASLARLESLILLA